MTPVKIFPCRSCPDYEKKTIEFKGYSGKLDILDAPCNSYVLLKHGVGAMSFLRPRRIRTSGKFSYGTKVRRPLNIPGCLDEYDLCTTRIREVKKRERQPFYFSSNAYRSNIVFF